MDIKAISGWPPSLPWQGRGRDGWPLPRASAGRPRAAGNGGPAPCQTEYGRPAGYGSQRQRWPDGSGCGKGSEAERRKQRTARER
ncbi:hypothetical protein [Propionispora sp. 2/2-37]|uniref:hypothetical protein n=1 Tax=Propionispora sp. 2/2-37 TaxID=1677858 RepID=UPI0012E1245A|nr:hypothetical protein [Propionispora sp. 2/2-37]